MDTLEDLTAAMDAQVFGILGDAVTYTPVGGSSVSCRIFIDLSDEERSFNAGSAIVPDRHFEARVLDMPNLKEGDVIVLTREPTIRYTPYSIRKSPSGFTVFARLKRIKSA